MFGESLGGAKKLPFGFAGASFTSSLNISGKLGEAAFAPAGIVERKRRGAFAAGHRPRGLGTLMAFRRSPPAGTVTGFMSAELSIDAMSSSVRTNGEASGTGKPATIGCMASAEALMLRAPSSNAATVPDVPARERAVPTARVKSGAWALVAVRAVARKSSWRELDIIIALLALWVRDF